MLSCLPSSLNQLLPVIREAKEKGDFSIEIRGYIKHEKRLYPIRLVIGNLPEEKAEAIRKRKRKKAKKNGNQIKEETLEYAGFVFLATFLLEGYDKEQILSIYRNRWQVELFCSWNPIDTACIFLENFQSFHRWGAVEDDCIRVSCEMDPPDGWVERCLALDTGMISEQYPL